jgi:cytoskeleton protein RodZ
MFNIAAVGRRQKQESRRMGSFGDRLRKEREQRGISLDDISLNTKIGTRLLRALEEEKFDQLPGGIFNKGFVRAYARHVGLDEEQAIADYLSAAGANPVLPTEDVFRTSPLEHVPETERAARMPQDRGKPAAEVPWGMLAIALLVIALAFASWSYFHREGQGQSNGIAPEPSSQPAPAAEPTQAPSTNPPPATPPPQGRNTAPSLPTLTRGSQGPVRQAALSEALPIAGAFTVRLKANEESEECWVSITVDGKPPIEAILAFPEEKTIQASREVIVKAGSVGALDFYFNGKLLPSQGDYGVVKTLIFHSDGLQPPQPPVSAR